MFYLYSTTLGGWLNKTANYTSNIDDAWLTDEAMALEICSRHLSKDNKFGMILVRKEDLEKVKSA